MLFEGRRATINHNFTTDKNPVYKYINIFRGGVRWYMMESKDFLSSFKFKFKKENGRPVSFNGQSITFRKSNKKVSFYIQ